MRAQCRIDLSSFVKERIQGFGTSRQKLVSVVLDHLEREVACDIQHPAFEGPHASLAPCSTFTRFGCSLIYMRRPAGVFVVSLEFDPPPPDGASAMRPASRRANPTDNSFFMLPLVWQDFDHAPYWEWPVRGHNDTSAAASACYCVDEISSRYTRDISYLNGDGAIFYIHAFEGGCCASSAPDKQPICDFNYAYARDFADLNDSWSFDGRSSTFGNVHLAYPNAKGASWAGLWRQHDDDGELIYVQTVNGALPNSAIDMQLMCDATHFGYAFDCGDHDTFLSSDHWSCVLGKVHSAYSNAKALGGPDGGVNFLLWSRPVGEAQLHDAAVHDDTNGGRSLS